jgi:arylsulfatase A-like enzyme
VYSQVIGSGNTAKKIAAKVRKPPNFIIFLINDLGWADVVFNGSTFYQTPHIDALAARSMQFRNAYAASPVCSPSRGAAA